jgi:hypothetical protein
MNSANIPATGPTLFHARLIIRTVLEVRPARSDDAVVSDLTAR